MGCQRIMTLDCVIDFLDRLVAAEGWTWFPFVVDDCEQNHRLRANRCREVPFPALSVDTGKLSLVCDCGPCEHIRSEQRQAKLDTGELSG